ncbi:uncharacterized protein BYT42DRAFT_612850 [Radiomyces spectabilis]|uniref:uncharacterized protein n=1 Tax=Radiomyces spectabilis TaxID=64574 RepID=UPI00221FA421|nr:uncharacterized protein BYT42DRAFT_612850 [Radiomyces spectabilis]KAI8381028.1 hypothetical protein BYT42DRAFT_612850 [Radiomyces spectabilis]
MTLCDDAEGRLASWSGNLNCIQCDSETVEVRDEQLLVCNHKKEYCRLKNIDKGEEDDVWMMTAIFFAIHQNVVKADLQCKSANDDSKGLIWNRDINAAVNIRRILQAYINSGCRLDSRPASLQRHTQAALDDESLVD